MNVRASPRSRYGPAVFAAALVVLDLGALVSFGGFDVIGVSLLMFGVVGALIVWRQPGNKMGWLFAAIGVFVGIGGGAQAYAERVIPGAEQATPFMYLTAWITAWWWLPMLVIIFVFIPLLFPTGTVIGPRWRWIARLAALILIAFGVMSAVVPRLKGEGYNIDNPIGVSLQLDPENSAVGSVMFFVLLFCMAGAILSMIVRFRRSRGVERQQLKWFLLAVLLIPLVNVLQTVVPIEFFKNSDVPFSIAVGGLPIAAGIAILRYRLYEIDVVVNKALVYGSLTAALALGYLALVALAQRFLPVGGGGIGVAASTLAMAAAFAPLRRRIQGFVDRRFYRRKYDATREIEEFGARLRREVQLEGVLADLREVVADTMQPATVGIWLRPPRSTEGSPS